MQSFHQEMSNQELEGVTDFGAINGIATTLNLRSIRTDTSADHRTPPSHHCSACGGCFIKKRLHSSSSLLLSPTPKKKLLFSPSSSAVVNDGEVCEFVKSSLPLLHRWNSSDSTISSEIRPRSPARAIASLPPRRKLDPPPLAYQEISPPSQFPIGPSSIVRVENPKYKKMKEQLKEMIQHWEDIDNEEENGGEDIEQEEKEEEEETETISVERHGNSMIIQLNCSCGKDSQILLSGKHCYHKLL